MLDPSCPLGHDVFADSANNGPVGQALVTEFLPAFDLAFRTVADARARFLTGHSSGGWSSLWLQVTYPDNFGGTWSTSPDPVDFRDFQAIDVYHPGENMYFDRAGKERPLARVGGRSWSAFATFGLMEDVLGPGGQLRSFEAVFSPAAATVNPCDFGTARRGPSMPTWLMPGRNMIFVWSLSETGRRSDRNSPARSMSSWETKTRFISKERPSY